MKTEKKIIATGITLMLIIVGLIGCIEDKPEETKSNGENLSEGETLNLSMDFSFSECGVFTFNETETGINETNWIDDTTLNVKANVLINCGEEIINGSYQLVNDTITLNYIAPECNPENCMDCMCGVVLFYNFTNLHKKNYTFRLVRLGVQ